MQFSGVARNGQRGTNIRIRFKNFTLKPAYLKEIVFGGSPSLCRQGLASLSTILLNVAAGAYGDAAIAGMSIVTRICMFINSFVIGFGQGFQPVCGFNYGAGIYRRVREGFWFCVKTGVVFLAVCSVIGYISLPRSYRGSAMIRMLSKPEHVPYAGSSLLYL